MDSGIVPVQVTGERRHLIVRGVVDREAARQIDFLVDHEKWELPAAVVIDISRVEEVSGALIGSLLRASRRLAWRNRSLTIVCPQPELRSRLHIAGLDELADIVGAVEGESRGPGA